MKTEFIEADWNGQIYESDLWTCPHQIVGHFGGLKITGLITEFKAWDLSDVKDPNVARPLRMVEVHKVIKNLGGVLGYHGLGLFNAKVVRVMEFTPLTLEETFPLGAFPPILQRPCSASFSLTLDHLTQRSNRIRSLSSGDSSSVPL